MAEIYKNDRGHLVIKLNAEEATELQFGIFDGGKYNICLCGTCNTPCNTKNKDGEMYYVAGINEVLCPACIEDFCKNMNHFDDETSLTYEIRHFNAIAAALNMKERAMISEGKVKLYEQVENTFESWAETASNEEIKDYIESNDADSILASGEYQESCLLI